jgi:general secretion pathway protein C
MQPQLLESLEQWLGRRWVTRTINMAALALLTFALAQWTWRLLTPPQSGAKQSAVATNDATGDYNLPSLLSANLFGQAAPSTSGRSLESIPLSSLNLILSGVMVMPAGSFALISADGGPEAPFAVGQEVVAGASLYQVYADRVLIQRRGVTESLLLKDSGAPLPSGSIVTAARPDAGIQQSGPRNFSVDRQQMNQQMQKPEFLSQALMVPNAGGGFLVREIQPGSLYEKLGLKVGDVINNVNGQPVNTVDDVMRLYQQLGAGGTAAQISIDVRRAGKNESLQYNIQ